MLMGMHTYKRHITFIHIADLHLGSPLTGISEQGRHISGLLDRALYFSFDTIIRTCLEKEVDFLLIAGDVFDSGEKNISAIHHFVNGISTLRMHGIDVIIATGNHDPLEGKIGSTTIWEDIARISGTELPYTLITSDKAEVVNITRDGEVTARICGVSFVKEKVFHNPVRHFPVRDDHSIPWIGLVHGTIGTSSIHIPYAPCNLSDLTTHGYDYWALGHIHARTTIRDHDPVIRYPGNIQGRNWGETGPKGCFFVTIDTDGVITTEFIETSPIRFETRELSIIGMEEDTALIREVGTVIKSIESDNPDKSAVCNITLTGSGPLHSVLIQTSLLQDILSTYQEYTVSPPFWFLSAIYDHTTSSIDRESMRGRGDLYDEICTCTDSLIQESGLSSARSILSPLYGHHSIRHIIGDVSDDDLKVLIKKAEDVLFHQLGAADED